MPFETEASRGPKACSGGCSPPGLWIYCGIVWL